MKDGIWKAYLDCVRESVLFSFHIDSRKLLSFGRRRRLYVFDSAFTLCFFNYHGRFHRGSWCWPNFGLRGTPLYSHSLLYKRFDHDTEIFEPIPVGATVRISAKAIDKFIKRERRYVRHEVTVEDVGSGVLYMRETRDILSL